MRYGEMRGIREGMRRAAAWVLSLALLAALLPAVAPQARAADWMQPYLDKLVAWNVMRGDINGNLNPERGITRAEFVTMVNRAYGYRDMGDNPFQDVHEGDWYADDIRIAYKTGYFAGTSAATASPHGRLTREQAVTILARNMMLEARAGEALGFSDSREMNDWSRTFIQAAADAGIVSGYTDGSFRPKNAITRGEVAVMLVRAVGSLVQKPGEQSLGSVYGNVTVTSPGVTLRNTVIAGDLYLTGGVGLGDVLLENVTVLGKIVACGAGESNKGESSIVLRNVTADEMVVDSIANQFVTIRAEGDTEVGSTSVRTSAYIEDVTRAGVGLKYIELAGEEKNTLQLAGNIKEVVNLAPNSSLILGRGTADKVTIDEKAVNSLLTVSDGANIKELNLDVATKTSGKGDIGRLNVNAPGSSVTLLPDTITVRPGITADVNGETMDTVVAAESSKDPRLLAGYPLVHNVAPTSAEGVFSTNKRGTVYWALTALTDGSVSEADLLDPPAYSSKILKSGKLSAASSGKELMAKLPGLTSDGSYYLSAVMVDDRGQHSPVKVAAFTTPDNTVPKFAAGYPYMSKIGSDSAQVSVMSGKSCQLYWAVLPKGGTAPTVKDFKTGAVSGNLGYGSMDVKKNVASVFTVNSQTLKELATYDLYLCLIDADGGKDSGVKKVTFTTVDGTPPVFLTEPTVNSIKTTSVGLTACLNEAGTIYWVVVRQGEEYPKPLAGQATKPTLDSAVAKLQVASGMNALKAGKVTASANKDVTISVTGLQAQTAYDLYYLAQDKAGNYSAAVKMVTIHSLDDQAPTVTQVFTKTGDAQGKEPLPDTDVRIIFSEGVQDKDGGLFLELYNTSVNGGAEQDTAKAGLLRLLQKDIRLIDASSFPHVPVPQRTEENQNGDWIDYEGVTVTMEDGKTVFLFKNGDNLHLSSGGTYYFQVADIADTSNNKNLIKPNPQNLPQFTTVFAKVSLTSKGVNDGPVKNVPGGSEPVRVDMSFQLHPLSTGSVDPAIFYDIFLWSDSILRFDLYARIKDANGGVVEDPRGMDQMLAGGTAGSNGTGWVYLGEMGLTPEPGPADKKSVGTSVHRGIDATKPFPRLNNLKEGYTYEYVVSLKRVNELTDPDTWSQRVTIGVTVPAGPETNVSNLAMLVNQTTWKDALDEGLNGGGVKAVGDPKDFRVYRQFNDNKVPEFYAPYPNFTPGDAFVTMHLQLNRPGTVYYVLAPMQKQGDVYQPSLTTKDGDGNNVVPGTPGRDGAPPEDGSTIDLCPDLSTPIDLHIYQPNFTTSRIKSGSQSMRTGTADVRVEGLEARTTYFAFFVLKGESQNLSKVYCFQFTTENVGTPAVLLEEKSPKVSVTTTTMAELNWILYANKRLFPMLNHSFFRYVEEAKKETYKQHWETYFPGVRNAGTRADSPTEATPTVLDALLADMTGSERSVFDEYANETAYNEVLSRIQGKTTGDVEYAGRGALSLTEYTPEDVDCTTHMTPENQYYFLAAARNAQGSRYGFRAVGNVHIPDNAPPEFKGVSTTVGGYAAKQVPPGEGNPVYNVQSVYWQKNPRNYLYEGTVTVAFDERIYQLVEEKNESKKTLTTVTEDNLEGMLATSKGWLDLDVQMVGSVITIKFSGAADGASIFFFNEGTISDADSNAHPSGKKLVLTFDAGMTTKDKDPSAAVALPSPGFRAAWG